MKSDRGTQRAPWSRHLPWLVLVGITGIMGQVSSGVRAAGGQHVFGEQATQGNGGMASGPENGDTDNGEHRLPDSVRLPQEPQAQQKLQLAAEKGSLNSPKPVQEFSPEWFKEQVTRRTGGLKDYEQVARNPDGLKRIAEAIYQDFLWGDDDDLQSTAPHFSWKHFPIVNETLHNTISEDKLLLLLPLKPTTEQCEMSPVAEAYIKSGTKDLRQSLEFRSDVFADRNMAQNYDKMRKLNLLPLERQMKRLVTYLEAQNEAARRRIPFLRLMPLPGEKPMCHWFLSSYEEIVTILKRMRDSAVEQVSLLTTNAALRAHAVEIIDFHLKVQQSVHIFKELGKCYQEVMRKFESFFKLSGWQ